MKQRIGIAAVTRVLVTIFLLGSSVAQIGCDRPTDNMCEDVAESIAEFSGSLHSLAIMPFPGDSQDNIVTDKLIAAVVQSGAYTVVERDVEGLKQLMKELNISLTDMVDPETAAGFGKMLGAEAIIYGKVRNWKTASSHVRLGKVEKGTILWAKDFPGIRLVIRIVLFAIIAFVLVIVFGPINYRLGRELYRNHVIGGFLLVAVIAFWFLVGQYLLPVSG